MRQSHADNRVDISKQCFPSTGNRLIIPPASVSDGLPPDVLRNIFLEIPDFPAANFSPSEKKCWRCVQLIMSQPKIIQGGMGVAVSGWTLARTVRSRTCRTKRRDLVLPKPRREISSAINSDCDCRRIHDDHHHRHRARVLRAAWRH
jgi:hypothetical protein